MGFLQECWGLANLLLVALDSRLVQSVLSHGSLFCLNELYLCGPYKLIDAGGTWCYQSDPEEWTILGGSNITGHTFATVTMTQDGSYLETISIGDRMNAEYDVWIRYVKSNEVVDGEFNPMDFLQINPH